MRRFVNSVASVNRILCVENNGVVVVLNDASLDEDAKKKFAMID